jgi:hypothetical protein
MIRPPAIEKVISAAGFGWTFPSSRRSPEALRRNPVPIRAGQRHFSA